MSHDTKDGEKSKPVLTVDSTNPAYPPTGTFDITISVPTFQDIKSSGNIRHLRGYEDITIKVPGNGGRNVVSILPATITKVNMIYIKSDKYSTMCNHLFCKFGPALCPPNPSSSYSSYSGQSSEQQSNPYSSHYGQQQPGNPYGQQQPGNPYGQQQPGNPYGQQQPSIPNLVVNDYNWPTLELDNDIVLINSSLIKLIGHVNTLVFYNYLEDQEVTIRIVIGYDI